MRRVLSLLLVIVPALAVGQSVEPLAFRERTHDFGKVDEAKGPVHFEFTYTNTTPRHVKIVSVNPSCGCTVPDWTKEAVAPGQTGFVKVRFDPANRPGFFNKTLSVVTDTNAGPIVLSITGTVSSKVTDTQSYPVSIGNLKLKSRSFSMGSLYINMEPAMKVFEVMNGGTEPLSFLAVDGPDFITMQFLPQALDPGEKGMVRVYYDAQSRNTFGFVSDIVQIKTDDKVEPVKSVTVFTTLGEYYATPTPEEQKTVPVASIAELNLDAGQFPSGTTLERSVMLTNRGKKELKVRALVGNCDCITAKAEKQSLRPGESTKINIQFTPQTRGGTQQKAITVYTNDPVNPAQLVSVSVYINN